MPTQAEATHFLVFPGEASALRMKCTRYLCQIALSTLLSQTAQELHPERLSLAMAGGHAKRDDAVVAPDLDVGGVQPDIRPMTLDRPGQEGVDALVDLTEQARDLTFADPILPYGLDRIIHRPH